MIAVFGQREQRLVVLALDVLEQKYRSEKVPVPPELAAARTALIRQDPTIHADPLPAPQDQPVSSVLSIAEVARELKVHRRTVERLVNPKSGTLPSFTAGRRRLVRRDDLETYMKGSH